jgi:hypothetical protein
MIYMILNHTLALVMMLMKESEFRSSSRACYCPKARALFLWRAVNWRKEKGAWVDFCQTIKIRTRVNELNPWVIIFLGTKTTTVKCSENGYKERKASLSNSELSKISQQKNGRMVLNFCWAMRQNRMAQLGPCSWWHTWAFSGPEQTRNPRGDH